ncbi:D-beta-hydroxybutyrate dehydrogenase, mitochondrial-like [Glandiceps talaboti]
MSGTIRQTFVRLLAYLIFGLFVYIIYNSLFPLQPQGHGKFRLNLSHVPFTASLCLLAAFAVWIYMIPAKVLDVGRKAVFITGCDSGFGHSLAVHLDYLGFRVFAACLFKGGEGEQKLVKTCSDRLKTIQLDVTNQEQVDNALKEVERYLDGEDLWGLVNNAGMLFMADFELTPMSTIEKLMDVNCVGLMRITKAFLPLIRHSKGRIVNVASVSGRVTVGMHSVYAASKAGVELFSDGLRMEMEQWGVKVSIIEPAGFRTGLFTARQMESMADAVIRDVSPISRTDYGEEYLKSYRDRMLRIASSSSPYILKDLSYVVDAMTDALLSTAPKARYLVGKGSWIMMFVGMCLPVKTADYLLANIFAPKVMTPAGVEINKKKDKNA